MLANKNKEIDSLVIELEKMLGTKSKEIDVFIVEAASIMHERICNHLRRECERLFPNTDFIKSFDKLLIGYATYLEIDKQSFAEFTSLRKDVSDIRPMEIPWSEYQQKRFKSLVHTFMITKIPDYEVKKRVTVQHINLDIQRRVAVHSLIQTCQVLLGVHTSFTPEAIFELIRARVRKLMPDTASIEAIPKQMHQMIMQMYPNDLLSRVPEEFELIRDGTRENTFGASFSTEEQVQVSRRTFGVENGSGHQRAFMVEEEVRARRRSVEIHKYDQNSDSDEENSDPKDVYTQTGPSTPKVPETILKQFTTVVNSNRNNVRVKENGRLLTQAVPTLKPGVQSRPLQDITARVQNTPQFTRQINTAVTGSNLTHSSHPVKKHPGSQNFLPQLEIEKEKYQRAENRRQELEEYVKNLLEKLDELEPKISESEEVEIKMKKLKEELTTMKLNAKKHQGLYETCMQNNVKMEELLKQMKLDFDEVFEDHGKVSDENTALKERVDRYKRQGAQQHMEKVLLRKLGFSLRPGLPVLGSPGEGCDDRLMTNMTV